TGPSPVAKREIRRSYGKCRVKVSDQVRGIYRLPLRLGPATQAGTRKQQIGRDAAYLINHDTRGASSTARGAKASRTTPKTSRIDDPSQKLNAMILPHGRDVAEIRRHALAVDHKGEVSRENVFADAVAIQTRDVRKRMHDLMREAVQK